jgi:hypothetical protein
MMTNKLKMALTSAMTVAGSALAMTAFAAAPTTDEVVASSTSAITDAGGTVLAVFFGIVPTILLYVVPIAVVLFGINWILAKFRGKR